MQIAALCLTSTLAAAEPWLAPGDLALRSDIQALSDAGILLAPVMTWPLALGDIMDSVDSAESTELDDFARKALEQVRTRVRKETETGYVQRHGWLAFSDNPRIIRTFEDTPRDGGDVGLGVSWTGDRFAIRLNGIAVSNPSDEDSFRLDGSYMGVALGNWMLSAGYHERWWGPGWDGSLILSTNARPMPQISVQRNSATPFESKWLGWIGPWSLTSFMAWMDDDRVVKDALVFGFRATARPLDGLEIGLSRTAQWCGDGRPCNLDTFARLLLGKDNRGVNVGDDQEPGNQLAGIDARWASPVGALPYALYFQWIGEDTRQGGPQIGSWLRQVGVEVWGTVPGLKWRHRTHIEVADTACGEGAIGTSGRKYNCAYNHPIYTTGYRYKGRAIGDGMDGDGFTYAIGSTLIDQKGNSWNILARRVEINDGGVRDPAHSLSPTPQRLSDVAVSHVRRLPVGVLRISIGYSRLRDELNRQGNNDVSAFLEWGLGI